jgi:thioredoxin reductase (NADPH)
VNPFESIIGGRRDQAFPVLSQADISRLERFGQRRRYRRGERLFGARERTPGMFLVLKGALTMTARDGLGRMAQVVRHGPGQFTGEVAQLSTSVAVVDADADDDVEAC